MQYVEVSVIFTVFHNAECSVCHRCLSVYPAVCVPHSWLVWKWIASLCGFHVTSLIIVVLSHQ